MPKSAYTYSHHHFSLLYREKSIYCHAAGRVMRVCALREARSISEDLPPRYVRRERCRTTPSFALSRWFIILKCCSRVPLFCFSFPFHVLFTTYLFRCRCVHSLAYSPRFRVSPRAYLSARTRPHEWRTGAVSTGTSSDLRGLHAWYTYYRKACAPDSCLVP